tara:strand:+ start:87 stop:629 length:543 start_codon:yes stop_codon:yes gene_type:complete
MANSRKIVPKHKNTTNILDVENNITEVQMDDSNKKDKKLQRIGLHIECILSVLFTIFGIVTLVYDREARKENEKFYYVVLAITLVSALTSYFTYKRCTNYEFSYLEMIYETFVYVLLFIESLITVLTVYIHLLSEDNKDYWKEHYIITFQYLFWRSGLDIIHLVIFFGGICYCLLDFIRS